MKLFNGRSWQVTKSCRKGRAKSHKVHEVLVLEHISFHLEMQIDNDWYLWHLITFLYPRHTRSIKHLSVAVCQGRDQLKLHKCWLFHVVPLSLQLTFLVPADWITPWFKIFKFWCKTPQIFRSKSENPAPPVEPLSLAPLVPLRVENDSSLSVDLLGIAAWSQIVILSRWTPLCQLCQDNPRRSKISNTLKHRLFHTDCQDLNMIPRREKRCHPYLQLSFLGTFPSQFLCFFELWDFYGFLRFSSQEGKILRLTLVCRCEGNKTYSNIATYQVRGRHGEPPVMPHFENLRGTPIATFGV